MPLLVKTVRNYLFYLMSLFSVCLNKFHHSFHQLKPLNCRNALKKQTNFIFSHDIDYKRGLNEKTKVSRTFVNLRIRSVAKIRESTPKVIMFDTSGHYVTWFDNSELYVIYRACAIHNMCNFRIESPNFGVQFRPVFE